MLHHTFAQGQGGRGYGRFDLLFMGLAVEAKRLVLPILMQRRLEITAALITGEAKRLRRFGLLNREGNKLGVGFHDGLELRHRGLGLLVLGGFDRLFVLKGLRQVEAERGAP